MKIESLKNIGLLLAGCLLLTAAHAQKIKTISFGNNNFISYNLSTGTYNIAFNGVECIKNAKVEVGNSFTNNYVNKYAKYKVSQNKLANHSGQCISVKCSIDKNRSITQLFYVYPDKNYFFTQLEVSGFEDGVNYLSPLSGDIEMQKGDNRAVFMPFDNDAWIRYKSATLDKTDFTSAEVTTIYNNDNKHGFVLGSIQQTDWKSGVRIKGNHNESALINIFAGYTDSLVTRDKMKHGILGLNGVKCSSPRFMIGYFDDWQTGMETYAKCITKETQRIILPWNKAKPMGWNSWGVIQTKLNETNTKGVVDFFADSCKAFRSEENSLYIDLDSYWDMFSDTQLKQFADYCKQKGLKPGIYWAPFTDWGKNGNRTVEGSTYKYADCWTHINGGYHDFDGARAMDPTHPATKARIAYFINRFKKCGFEMIKIDFIGHGAIEADTFYNKNVHTGMQAFCEGMECLDKEIDGSMLVYVAISPNIITYRYAHVRRIACDAFRHINETAYTLNSTGFGWWQNALYDYIDADHVVFSNATEGANRARFASSIVTGTVLMGDDYTANGSWKEHTKKLLQNEDLLPLVRSKNNFRAKDINVGDGAPGIFTYTDNMYTYVALFNYDKKEKTFAVNMKDVGLTVNQKYDMKELFTGVEKQLTGAIQVTIQGEDALLFRIRK